MRATLRRAVTLGVAAAALALGVATVASAPAAAEPVCQAGTNWDGVLKVCR
jgi:ABC-type proline/glycine betaine transport system substrate-binding protein